MNKLQVIGHICLLAVVLYCLGLFLMCAGICAGCAGCSPPPPPVDPPASGPTLEELVNAFRAFLTLVKLCITLGFVMAKGLSLTTYTWDDLRELITKIDRSSGGLSE